MPTSGSAPATRCVITKTPSGNPLPRRGKVKQTIAKHIVAAAASVLLCDAGGGSGGRKSAGGKIMPAPPGAAKKK